MTKTGLILKTIVFGSIVLYSRLVFGQPGPEPMYVGIDISSVDTNSLTITAYQASYDTLNQRVNNKLHYQKYSFSNKKAWSYSKSFKTPTISFQRPINVVILTSDTRKMEIFFRNLPRDANMMKYPIIFQPGVYTCDGIPDSKKSFIHVKDSTLNEVIKTYYLSQYQYAQYEKEKQQKRQEEAEKRKLDSENTNQKSRTKIYPRTDTISNNVYYYKTEEHIVRTTYKTKDLKVKVSECEYISFPNQPTSTRKLISVSEYFDSGRIQSELVKKKKWSKHTTWNESGKKIKKYFTRSSNGNKHMGYGSIVWTFRYNGKIKFHREKIEYIPYK
ncbi:MAG: hypothetical protein A3K10_09315 [Bacteroidetes bacterium RIFCSPLOWO2_12_FULL_31_6]|nr:MAG: hypothetical protein A3K10_09315 [Bacteroidetes bacterium RIFCSPLOWO2_12_FULL_31_6]